MTESEWLTCDKPQVMAGFLSRRSGDPIKATGGGGIPNHKWLRWVEACQQKSNPTIDWNPCDVWEWIGPNGWEAACPLAYRADVLRDVVGNPFTPVRPAKLPRWETVRVGRTKRRSALDWASPPSPDYITPTVLAVGLAAHDDRKADGTLYNDRLAVLSDALEEDGCDDLAILGHLRRPHAVHVRGCHILDLILGRE